MKKLLALLPVLVIAVVLVRSSVFTVSETEYVIVTTFGKPVRTISEPGFNRKWPAPIQSVLRFDKRLQIFDPRPTESFTLDRKNLVIDTFTCWRIADPDRFLVKVGSLSGAENSLSMLVASRMGSELGKHELSDLISIEPDQVKLTQIMQSVTDACKTVAEENYGIDVVDVRIKRINLPDENKESVYERMRAEREQKAKEYRASGEEEAMAIRSKTELEKREILSAAYRDAQQIKGQGDADAIRIYQEAYQKNPDFYTFMRTLSSYKTILGEETTMVMSAENDLLKLLTEFNPKALAAGGAAPSEAGADTQQAPRKLHLPPLEELRKRNRAESEGGPTGE